MLRFMSCTEVVVRKPDMGGSGVMGGLSALALASAEFL